MSKKIYIKIDKPIEVGDLVRCVKNDGECRPGDIRKVSRMGEYYDFYVHGSGGSRWQPYWEPVRREIKTNESRREEMEHAIGEMIVELMDEIDRNDHHGLVLINYRKFHNSIRTHLIRKHPFDRQKYGAKLHPDDTWDTLTGIFVALSKAAGRKLPDWIYE